MLVALNSALFTLLAAAPAFTTVAGPPPDAEPAPAPVVAPEPAPARIQTQQEPSTGLGFLIGGSAAIVLGVPFSVLGSNAWRNSCGPTDSDSTCSGGSVRSFASHTVSVFSYGAGIALIAVGGERYGRYAAARDARENGRVYDRSGLIVAGAILLPTSLIGMVAARTLYWIPTPECQTEGCVKGYQRTSTAVVAGFAVGASAGAGMMMYGLSYKKWVRKNVKLSLAPNIGRGSGGLVLRGEF